jgi:hypothetical protein
MRIVCPSGLAGEIRGLKVKELQTLADRSLAQGGKALDVMLGVFSEVTNAGPYPFEVGGVPRWNDVLAGDRFAALIDIRCATWGPEYVFPMKCASCEEPYEWELDLRDLHRKPFPAATLSQIRERNRFETEGPRGETVAFKILTGTDEKSIGALRRRNGGRWGLADAICAKVLSVSGIREGRERDWVLELDALEARDLGLRMDEVDGGVETEIEVYCEHCQWRETIQLPFGKTFYTPSRNASPKAKTAIPTTEPRTAPSTPNAKAERAGEIPTGSSSPAKRTG